MAAPRGAAPLVVVTEWTEFRSPDFDELKRVLKLPLVFDGRNLYEPALVRAAGLEHFSIGRHWALTRGRATPLDFLGPGRSAVGRMKPDRSRDYNRGHATPRSCRAGERPGRDRSR